MKDFIFKLKNVNSKREGFDLISSFSLKLDEKILKEIKSLLKSKELKEKEDWFKEFYDMIETAIDLKKFIFSSEGDKNSFIQKLKSLNPVKSRYAIYIFLYNSRIYLNKIDNLLSEMKILIEAYGLEDAGVGEKRKEIEGNISTINWLLKSSEILSEKLTEKSKEEIDLVCDLYFQIGVLNLYKYKISVLLKDNLTVLQNYLKNGKFYFEKVLNFKCPSEMKIYSLLNLASMYKHHALCISLNYLNSAKNELLNIDEKSEIYESLELEINGELSSILLKLGKYRDCYNLLEPYIEKLERKIYNFLSPQLILEFINRHKYIYENMVISCIELGKTESRYKEKALEYLEKIKSRVFLESWRLKLNSLDLESNKELAEKRKKLIEELNYLSFNIPENENRELELLRINQILEELGKIEDILIRSSKFKIFYLEAHPVNLREENIFSLIPDSSLFFEYFLTKEKIYIFVIDKNGILDIKEIKFKNIELIKDVFNLFLQTLIRENFSNIRKLENMIPELSSIFEPAENLAISYDLLIKPVSSYFKGKEILYIIPYGELFKVPFHALIKREKGKEFFLIEEISVAYLPSLSVFRILKQKEESLEKCFATGLSEEKGGPKLGEKEAEMVAKLWNTKPYPPKKDIFLKGTEDKDIIHISTHSINDRILADYNGLLFEDGVLLPSEIETLSLKASLVFLSACSTYLEDINPANKYISLTGSFIKAGAKTVIASLLPVAAQPTYILVEEFYKNLKKGEGKAKSLQKAQLKLINEYSWHPYFWGTFFLIGIGD